LNVLFVLTERAAGLTPERSDRYETARARLASALSADVETVPHDDLVAPDADALVLSGSFDPWALHRQRSLARLYEELRRYPGPVLGICAGMQILVRAEGGVVETAEEPKRGYSTIEVVDDTDLLAGLAPSFDVFQDHTDEVTRLPSRFRLLASSEACPVEVVAHEDRPWWGTQFHPEYWTDEHPAGREIIERYGELARSRRAS